MRPQLHGAGQRARAVGDVGPQPGRGGEQGRRVAELHVVAADQHRTHARRGSRRAPASRSRRPRPRPGGPGRARGPRRARWSGTRSRRSPGCRRQRASGRRRRAPRPVQGASTSTRSKDPAGHGGDVPSSTVTASTPSAPASARRTSSARCGSRSLATSRAPARGRQCGQERRPCRRDPRTGPASAGRRPRSARRRGRGRPAATPRPAPRPAPRPRPARRRGPLPTRPRRTARRRWARRAARRRADRPGRATSVTAGGSLSAASSDSSSSGRPPPTAPRRAPRRPTGGGCTPWPRSRSGRRRVGSHPAYPLLAVVLGDLAEHGVGEAGRTRADLGADQVDAGADGGVRRHPHPQQLVTAEPEDVEDLGLGVRQRPVGAGGEDRVVGALTRGWCPRPARSRTPRRGRSGGTSRARGAGRGWCRRP